MGYSISDRVTSLGVLTAFAAFVTSEFLELICDNLCTLRPDSVVFYLSFFYLLDKGVGGFDCEAGLVIFYSNYRLLGLYFWYDTLEDSSTKRFCFLSSLAFCSLAQKFLVVLDIGVGLRNWLPYLFE